MTTQSNTYATPAYANAILIDNNDTPVPSAPLAPAPLSTTTATIIPEAKLVPYGATPYYAGTHPFVPGAPTAPPTAVPHAKIIKNPSIQGLSTSRPANAASTTTNTQIIYTTPTGQQQQIQQQQIQQQPFGAEERYATLVRRRNRRARGRVVSTIGGIVVGGVLLGPLGIIIGGLGAPAVTTAALKRGERRKDQRIQARRALS